VKRRPPVRHRVRGHWRAGIYVESYMRGSRKPERATRRPRVARGLRWRVRLVGARTRVVTVGGATPAQALLEAVRKTGESPRRATIRRVE